MENNNKIPTALEYLAERASFWSDDYPEIASLMISFSQLHVKEALIHVALSDECIDIESRCIYDSYPLNNIK